MCITIYIYIYIHTYVCMHVCMHVYTHRHILTHLITDITANISLLRFLISEGLTQAALNSKGWDSGDFNRDPGRISNS